MSGPRDLRRGNKPHEKRATLTDIVGGKRNYFTVEQWGSGWAINVHRAGKPLETILCATPGEVNRHRMRLSGDGLVGYVGGPSA